MQRLFENHKKRYQKTLDGAWQFAIDPKNVGVDEKWYNNIPNSTTVTVPSVWNTQLGLLSYEGTAWYSRSFYTDGGTLRFVFGGVMTEADVWLDGEKLGYHYGGFCEFDLVAYGVTPGDHILAIRVSNSFDACAIPQPVVDWYHYGGITRSITLESLDGIAALSNRMEYELDLEKRSAKLRFAIELLNSTDTTLTDTLTATVAGASLSLTASLAPRECREVYTDYVTVTDLSLWSPDTPTLYDITVKTSTDDLYDRGGFRLVSVEDGAIKLNGKPVELLGVNRHEENTEFGMAFPPALMRRDIDIISDMGCNTVRGSHYPNNPIFVDMLDERGIMFWSEIPMWGGGFSEECLADPITIARGEAMHRDMVKYYYNHPSIIIWGMHNEIKSDTKAGYDISKIYYDLLKSIGGNRIVSYATNHAMTDISLEFCDVICINQYNGWYHGPLETWADFLDKFRARREALGISHKPVIMSEFGAASVWGHHSFDDVRWSEEYHANLIRHCLTLYHNDPMVVGSYIWQFADIRTCLEVGLTRARCYNNKGLVNEHRNPKAAYFAAKELYHKFKSE